MQLELLGQKYDEADLKNNVQEIRTLLAAKKTIRVEQKSLVRAYFTYKFFEELTKKQKADFVTKA